MKSGFRLKNAKILLTYAQCLQGTAEEFGLHFKWTFQNIIPFTYIICCQENHHETDGNHYHIFFTCNPAFETKNERVFDLHYSDGCESITFHPNIEIVKSTPWKVVEYVKKDGNYWEYLPENAPKQSITSLSRKEKNKLLRKIDPLNLYLEDEISAIQCANLIKAKKLIKQEAEMKITKREKPIVLWFFGPTGTGKTRTAVEIAEEAGKEYWMSHGETLNWFDGYTGQEYAIIDDFRRGMCKFNYLLRLLDRYTLAVPIKGGFTKWNPKVIIITCPVSAKESWQYFDKDGEIQDWDHIEQLIRRIDDEIEFN